MKNQALNHYFNKSALRIGAVLTVILLAIALLWQSNAKSNQAVGATLAQVYFEGEYRIGDGGWQPIVEGKHIPSTQGDVTLLGKFHILSPGREYIGIYDGALPIAFYANHVNLTIREGSGDPHRSDNEHPMIGAPACGINWVIHSFTSGGKDQIEILVRNFSLYLRCNFSELTSVTPIRFAEELLHVEYYANIEKVRFPDIGIEYDVQSTDFLLPALSVQPLVENAIKHGLMKLERGGRVLVRSYETQTHFCIEVTDDGVGFDTSLPIDAKKHIGLRNIRERLKAMVNGELLIESEINVGTKAVILIPKE